MSALEKGIVNRERLVVDGISALYVGTQDPTIRDFVQKSWESIADRYLEADEEIPTTGVEDIMLTLVENDPRKRELIRKKALLHAKGVLDRQSKSPERDGRLQVISVRLLELNPLQNNLQ